MLANAFTRHTMFGSPQRGGEPWKRRRDRKTGRFLPPVLLPVASVSVLSVDWMEDLEVGRMWDLYWNPSVTPVVMVTDSRWRQQH